MDYILVLLYTQFATTRRKIIMKFASNIVEYVWTLDDWKVVSKYVCKLKISEFIIGYEQKNKIEIIFFLPTYN